MTGWLERLASLKLTLLILALLGAGVVVSFRLEAWRTWPLVVPLALLALNLAAAVATNKVFRHNLPLLNFHLALITLVLLIAAGRMTYLKGGVELPEGKVFDGELTSVESGPWHRDRLREANFVNEGFTIEYAPGLQRGPTRNRVAWRDDTGRWQRSVIGDHEPLVLAGYRFYTSPNKGFALMFEWAARGQPPVLGAVHLPSFPAHSTQQAQEWIPPGGRTPLWVGLKIDEKIVDPERESEFRLPASHSLVVRIGEDRREIVAGDTLELAEGRLTYRGLVSWMGYKVFYDWTLPWLLGACVVAVGSLGWHFWRKFAARPWNA